MRDDQKKRGESLPVSAHERIDSHCQEFEAAWKADPNSPPPQIQQFLSRVERSERPALFRELLALELEYRMRGGYEPSGERYLLWFPQFPDEVRSVFERIAPADPVARPEPIEVT